MKSSGRAAVGGTKAKCIGLVAAGVCSGLALHLLDHSALGVIATLTFCTIAVLVGIADALRDIRLLFRAASEQRRNVGSHVVANVHSLLHLREECPPARMPVSHYSMKPSNLEALLDIVVRLKPRRVVELGCGISTLYVAHWLQKHGSGRVLSFEHDEVWAETCRRSLIQAGLDDFAEVRTVPLISRSSFEHNVEWYDIEEQVAGLSEVDLLVVDGPPAGPSADPLSRLPAMEVLSRHLSQRAVVFLDDGSRAGERQVVKVWTRAYPEFEPRYFSTLSGYWVLSRKQDS